MKHLFITSLLCMQIANVSAATPATDELLASYRTQGASQADPQRGRQLWTQKFSGDAPQTERSCASCHTDRLTSAGKHIKTGKAIEPLAPSVNMKSLRDTRNIEKWLGRNCKWTLGRACSVQEKADLLAFMRQQ